VAPASPLTPDEIAAVRKAVSGRVAAARPPPYHDPAIHEFERTEWFRRDLDRGSAGSRTSRRPGTYCQATVDDEPAGRGSAAATRSCAAFYKRLPASRDRRRRGGVRHSGSASSARTTPWIYDLDGSLIRAKHTEDLDDFTFAEYGLKPIRVETVAGLRVHQPRPRRDGRCGPGWATSAPHLARFDFGDLRVAHTETYEVDANWKFIGENYSECYHCPGIHPQLNKLTPYDLGGDFAPDGPWQGGWMELVDDAETMALDGGHRAGRPGDGRHEPSWDDRRIYYYLIWPSTFLSIHPDYLLVHRLEPVGAGHNPDHVRLVCSSRRPSPPPGSTRPTRSAFWDLTNRQDWHVCELQQRATAISQAGSPGATPTRSRASTRST